MYVDSPAFNENRDSEFEFYNFPFYPLKLDLLGDGKWNMLWFLSSQWFDLCWGPVICNVMYT